MVSHSDKMQKLPGENLRHKHEGNNVYDGVWGTEFVHSRVYSKDVTRAVVCTVWQP